MGFRNWITNMTPRASKSRVDVRARLRHPKTRTEVGAAQSMGTAEHLIQKDIETADRPNEFEECLTQTETDTVIETAERLILKDIETADRPNESEEWLTQTETDTQEPQDNREETASFFKHPESANVKATSKSTISSTAIQDNSITFAEVVEGIKNLTREDLLNIRAMLIGVLPLGWHLLRVSFAPYLPLLSWTPRFITTATAPFALGIFWCTARAEPMSQKIRLMNFVASASNGLILILESWVGLYYGWLCFTDSLPPWKTGDTASEGIWILALFSMSVFVGVNTLLSLFILLFIWDEQLDGCITDFKDRLFSEPEEQDVWNKYI